MHAHTRTPVFRSTKKSAHMLGCDCLHPFPSGATLIVEEYNPPCHDMSEEISKTQKTKSGDYPGKLDFLKAAKKLRGLVGIVDVAGEINEGDDVKVQVFDSDRMFKFLSS